jgi:hypothetical protein
MNKPKAILVRFTEKQEPVWKDPVAVFNNECSAFIIDDHCYVLVNTKDRQACIYRPSLWLFPEALQVLGTLPPIPKSPDRCNYDENMRQLGADRERLLNLQTTRHGLTGSDAWRDFDSFDVNEELSRLRRALVEPLDGKNDPSVLKFVYTAIANIDEHLLRGGPLPKAWERYDEMEGKVPGEKLEARGVPGDTILELVDRKLEEPEGRQKLIEFAHSYLKDLANDKTTCNGYQHGYFMISRTVMTTLVKLLGKLAGK